MKCPKCRVHASLWSRDLASGLCSRCKHERKQAEKAERNQGRWLFSTLLIWVGFLAVLFGVGSVALFAWVAVTNFVFNVDIGAAAGGGLVVGVGVIAIGMWIRDSGSRIKPVIAGPRLMAFLFTDLVDSTGMKQRMGDATYVQAVLQPHNKLFHDALSKFTTAVERDNAGDGFFATFDSLSEAVEFALLFQQGMDDFAWMRERPQTRVGIHLGDAIQFREASAQQKSAGQAQDMAARLMGLASGGQILLSRAVSDGARQYVRKHPVAGQGVGPELAWVGHGAYQLKGRDEAIEVFEVGTVGRAPLRAPGDSEKAWRVAKSATAG